MKRIPDKYKLMTRRYGLAVVVVLVTLIVAIFPKWFPSESPAYDFVYYAGDAVVNVGVLEVKKGIPAFIYQITEGKLLKVETSSTTMIAHSDVPAFQPQVKFFLHHVIANTSVPITFVDAEQYVLEQSKFAPDGFEFVHGKTYGSVLPFFFNTADGYLHSYVKKGRSVKEVHLNLMDEDLRKDFFVGWVVK